MFYFLNFEGIFNESLQLSNILLFEVTLDISHLEISGRAVKDKQPLNILFILLTLEVFHLEISDNDFSDAHYKTFRTY